MTNKELQLLKLKFAFEIRDKGFKLKKDQRLALLETFNKLKIYQNIILKRKRKTTLVWKSNLENK